MQIRLLGTVEIATQEGVRRVGGAKERRLLALLALRAGEVVSEDCIVDALWGDEPPRTASKTIQGHVSRLRRALADGGFRIEAHGPGYVLRVPPMGTDVEHVAALLAEGRELAVSDPMGAVAVFVQALAAWRGPALIEFADDPLFVGDAARLAELRLSVVEERVAAELACGRHGALAGELEALCRAHPTRERLWAYRMRALYGSGRQVDALTVYQELRRYLGEELGLEPSSELRALEQAILTHDPSLDWHPPAAATSFEPTLAGNAKTLPSGVVTFVLTDIEGSTALWDAHPPEMAEALALHDRLIADAVARHGGTLLKTRGEGDSTFSVFPRATGAVAAALAIGRAFTDTAWPASASLQVRTAIHTGEAHERDGDYYGPTVNRAARLRGIAAGGQILLSQSVADLVADHVGDLGAALVELGAYQFADLTRPERAYELHPEGDPSLVELTSSEAPCPPFPAPLAAVTRAPFVGRVRERELLARLLEEASSAGRAVLVAGEPGIGKTRVAAAVAADAHADGACVLYGRCDEDASAPYQPMVEALSTYAAAIPRPVLRAQVGHSGAELARLVPDIADVVLTKPSQPGADPDSDRYRLFEAVSRFVATLASTRPVVVVLDDLHWADMPTLLLVRHLLRSTAQLPILLLGTYRDTELNLSQPLADVLADLRREQLIERIGLAGLRQDDISELTVATVGRDLPDKVVADIYHQTQGNPFFVGEVLHHLADSDAFDEKAIAQLGIPEGIREVVGRRVRRLEDNTVALLRVAAVMGREFDLDVVQTANGVAPGEALDSVEEALRARLVEEIPGTTRYAFTHALVRDTLYRELVTSRRVRLHGAIAEAIENIHGDRADWVGELAFHYTESAHAGGIDKAVQYSRRAGDQALTLFAYEDAVGHYEGALHALDLDQSGADDARRVEVLLALADAVWRVGGGVAARARFLEAGALARRLARYDLLADAALGMARQIVVSPLGAEGAPAVDDAHVALVQAALDTTPTADSELRARLLAAMAVATYYGTDQHQPRELADDACAMAERIGDTGALVETLSVRRAVLEAFDPEVDERLELDTRIEHLARQRGDLTTVADALLWQSADLLQLGRIDDADAALDRYAALAADLSDPRIPYWCLVYQATRARMEGRFTDAEQLATDALTLSGVQPAVALLIFGGQMLWMWVDQGRVGELRAAMDAILGYAAAMPAARAGLAVMATELDERDTAQIVWDELARADFDDFPHDAGRLAGLVCLTVACRALDDQSRASILYRLFLPYKSQHATAAAVVHLGPVDHYLGLLAGTTGDLDTAAAHFETALAMSLHIGARPFAAHTQAALADVLARRGQPGDEARANELLRASLATAEDLGMTPLADQARSQLSALPPIEETSTTGER